MCLKIQRTSGGRPARQCRARWCTPVVKYKCDATRFCRRGVGGQKGKRVDSKWSLSYSEGWHRPYFSRRIGLLSCTRIGSPLHACIEWGYPPRDRKSKKDRVSHVIFLVISENQFNNLFRTTSPHLRYQFPNLRLDHSTQTHSSSQAILS